MDDKGGSHINFTTSPHDGDDVELRDDDGERQLLRTSLTQKQKQMVKENWRFPKFAIEATWKNQTCIFAEVV